MCDDGSPGYFMIRTSHLSDGGVPILRTIVDEFCCDEMADNWNNSIVVSMEYPWLIVRNDDRVHIHRCPGCGAEVMIWEEHIPDYVKDLYDVTVDDFGLRHVENYVLKGARDDGFVN